MKKFQNISVSNLISHMVVAAVGTLGIAGVLQSVADYYVGLGFVIVWAVLFSVFYAFVLAYNGQFRLPVRIAGIIVPVIYAVLNIPKIISGFMCLADYFCYRADLGTLFGGMHESNSWEAASAYIKCIFVLIIMISAFLTALVEFRFTGMFTALLVIMPLLGFVIGWGFVPDLMTIIFCVLFVFDTMALGKPSENKRSTCPMLVISVVVALLVVFIIPKCNYTRSPFLDDARAMISDIVYEKLGIDLDGDRNEEESEEEQINAAVGIGNGRVGQVDKLYYDDKQVGTLTTRADNGISYIKIFTGRQFEQNNWTKWGDTRESQGVYSTAVYDLVLNLTRRNTYEFEENEKEIVKKFIVYEQSFRDKNGISYDSGLKYRMSGGDLLSYVSMGELMKKYRGSPTINSYEIYAGQQYMDVSSADRAVVEQVFGKRQPDTMEQKVAYVNEVVKYLKTNYKYTMRPGKVPEGRNVLEYFLTDTKKGYCTYFATSATLIFRCAGIPARYCAGYAVDTTYEGNSGERGYAGDTYLTSPVYDNSAHAWVEIFINGYGWVVIDPTPGYGDEEESEVPTANNPSDEALTGEDESERDSQNSSSGENEVTTQDSFTQSDNSQSAFSIGEFGIFSRISVKMIVIFVIIIVVMTVIVSCVIRIISRIRLLRNDIADESKIPQLYEYLEKLLAKLGYRRDADCDYELYIQSVIAIDSELAGMGLERAVNIILKVRFGNTKCVDKADITGIINTIRQVRAYALSKAKGPGKLIVCLI